MADRFGRTRADVDRTVWAIDGQGRMRSGAAAVNAALAELGPPWRLLAALERLPGLGWLEERAYGWVAAHRGWLSHLWGSTPECDQPGVDCM